MFTMSNESRHPDRGQGTPRHRQSRRLLTYALAYKVHDDNVIEVFDLDFAAFCHMRGLPVADMVEEGPKRNGQPPKYKFSFQGTKEQIQELSVEYTNSDCAKFADCIRRLKKAIRSTCPREA